MEKIGIFDDFWKPETVKKWIVFNIFCHEFVHSSLWNIFWTIRSNSPRSFKTIPPKSISENEQTYFFPNSKNTKSEVLESKDFGKVFLSLTKRGGRDKIKKKIFHLKTCHAPYLSNYLGPDGPSWNLSSTSISHIDLQKCFWNLKSQFFLTPKYLQNPSHFYYFNINLEKMKVSSTSKKIFLRPPKKICHVSNFSKSNQKDPHKPS